MDDAKKRVDKSPAAPDRGIEVTGYCTYEDAVDGMSEVEALAKSRWAPRTKDLKAVAETPNSLDALKAGAKAFEVRQVGVVHELIALFCRPPSSPTLTSSNADSDRPPMSVRRVNLIGHGNPGLLGLTGSVDFREAEGGVLLGEALSIDHLNNEGFGRVTARWLNEDDEGIPYRDRIRRVLTDDAEFALILCHSGQVEGQFLMRTMAEVFRTVMLGFRASIFYHPQLNAQRTKFVDRRITSVGFEGPAGAGYKCKTERPEAFAGKHLAYQVTEVSDAQVGIAAGRAAHREAARAGK